MKILQIITSLGQGGAENLVYNLLKRKENESVKMDLLLLSDFSVFDLEKLKDTKIYKSPYKMKSLKQIKFIKKVLRENYYDIVHVHLFPTIYFAPLAKKHSLNKNVKFVYTEHSTYNRRRKWFLRPIDNFFYKKYDSIISISEGVKNTLTKWLYKKNQSKVITIYNGVDLKKFKDATSYKKHELIKELKEEDILLLMVGSFKQAKDQMTIIKSLNYLEEKYKLLLVGEGNLLNEHKKYVIDNNLENRVFFLGSRDDIPKINKTADIIVVSSHWEGFGLVAVEGMAANKPVLGSNVEGLKEVIKDTNMLFTQGDAKELAKKIKEPKKALNVDVSKYSFQTMYENYINLYYKIMKEET